MSFPLACEMLSLVLNTHMHIHAHALTHTHRVTRTGLFLKFWFNWSLRRVSDPTCRKPLFGPRRCLQGHLLWSLSISYGPPALPTPTGELLVQSKGSWCREGSTGPRSRVTVLSPPGCSLQAWSPAFPTFSPNHVATHRKFSWSLGASLLSPPKPAAEVAVITSYGACLHATFHCSFCFGDSWLGGETFNGKDGGLRTSTVLVHFCG